MGQEDKLISHRKGLLMRSISYRSFLLGVMVILCFLAAASVSHGQASESQDSPAKYAFPFQIVIKSVSVIDTNHMNRKQEIESAEIGMEPPYFVFFYGTVNGENHWVFDCRKENTLRESIPCTAIPTGEYSGRWIHNYSIMQIVGDQQGEQISRFLNVSVNPKDPLVGDDPILHYGIFDFPVQFPNGKSLKDYPILAHVYDGTSLEIPVGRLPRKRGAAFKTCRSTKPQSTAPSTRRSKSAAAM